VQKVQDRLNRLLRNRSGAVIAGVAVALLALILLIAYLNSYRSSVNAGKQPERVLVATKLIQRGSSGTVIARRRLYSIATVPKDQLQVYAITDPSALQDRVAANDIFPGQQLTQNDFTTESPNSVPYELSGTQRAISVPVDASHGLIGQVSAGSHVDVYVGLAGGGQVGVQAGGQSGTVVTLLEPNVYVLVPPEAGSGQAVLRVNTADAAKFALAADNARIWLVLRPQTGASPTPPTTASIASLLAGADIRKGTRQNG
jgi:Flp pilus assembly protein CpaB